MTKLDTLTVEQSALFAERETLAKKVTAALVAEWDSAGGCQTCLGHGRVVTWWTLDGPGYTEYGTCKGCKAESPGWKPGSFWSNGNGALSGTLSAAAVNELPDFHAEAVMLNTYDGHLEALKAEIAQAVEDQKVTRGKAVVVVRGRKVPKGTTGDCFWVGPDKFGGERAGFTSADGTTFWTNKANLEVAA